MTAARTVIAVEGICNYTCL